MWNDNDTHVDLIDFQHLVSSIEDLINNEHLLPCTIGLYGDWGSGKSSLMRMVEKKFEGHENVLTVKFNGWLFEDYDNAKTVLMGAILDELIDKRTLGEKGKSIAKKLLKKIDWMKVTTSGVKAGLGFLALGPAGLLAGATDWINNGNLAKDMSEIDYDSYLEKNEKEDKKEKSMRMGIREFHNDFSELLRETKVEKLIVFIDDLDRCNPTTVIETLEAIKLFLFVDNSAFVISADERLIKYAVRRRFPEIPGEGLEVGRDYLEKLIQFPIRIPQLSNIELETYINLLFTKIHISDTEKFEQIRIKALEHKAADFFTSKYNIHTVTEIIQSGDIEKLKEDLSLSAQITPILTVGLNGNPRQSKRFLNTLLIRLGMAKSKKIDLSKKILSKLMLMEYFKPETFRRLSELQAQQEGTPKEISEAEKKFSESKGEEPQSKTKKSSENAEIESWVLDTWLSEWLKMDPLLSNVDLRPYFYFSRDILATNSGALQRMSPQAQEIYKRLISDSDVNRKKGLTDLESLNPIDTASIFSNFCEKIRQQETLSGDSHYLQTLLEICSKRSEHLSELFQFLKSLPVKIIPPSIIPLIKDVFSADGFEHNKNDILHFWASNSENKQLATLVKQSLKN